MFPNILKTLLVISGIPCLIIVFNLQFLNESPRYLIYKSDYSGAYTALINIAKINNTSVPRIGLQEELDYKLNE